MTRELNGFRIQQRLDAGNTNDFVLLLSNSTGARKLAAWTTEAGPHDVLLALSGELAYAGDSVSGLNGDGSPTKLNRTSSHLHFEVAPLPKYVQLKR
jgi:hypothetical protein